MSKIRFDLKKLPIPNSLRLAGRVLQAVDTRIHESAAKLVTVELFFRGQEQGFSLVLRDPDEGLALRAAFAQQYRGELIIIYYGPGDNMGDFMRQLTAFKNNEGATLKMKLFNLDDIGAAAQFICDFFDGIPE